MKTAEPSRLKKKRIEFDINGGVCYSFPTKDGINPEGLSPMAAESYARCKKGVETGEMEGPFYRNLQWKYTANAHGICECGKDIELYDQYLGACECPHCGRWHNMFGQELNEPAGWEEEYEEEWV